MRVTRLEIHSQSQGEIEIQLMALVIQLFTQIHRSQFTRFQPLIKSLQQMGHQPIPFHAHG